MSCPGELIGGANESTAARRQALLRRISDQCGADIGDSLKPPATVWNEYNSFFFCFTVVTTIGESAARRRMRSDWLPK